ncbi:hypothetical protein [Hyphococcus sp.]|uniref:hypothetical protein n=1 Tax=Hyphococcus sp. TaxID=2038636 RepID=UPI0035C6924C
MSHKPHFALGIASFVFSLCAAASAAAQGDGLNTIYDVDLSADGKHYAILRQYEGQRIIAIYNADNPSKPPLAVGLGDLPTTDFSWGDNDYVMVRVSGEKSGLRTVDGLRTRQIARWIVVDRKSGEMRTVFSNEIGDDYAYFINSAGDLISTLPGRPGHALFARASVSIRPSGASRIKEGEDDITYSLQELNLKRTRARVVERGDENTINWVVNEDGDAIARIDSISPERITVFTRPSGKGGFSQVADINYAESPYSKVTFYGPAETAGFAQAQVTDDNGAQKLVEFDLATGDFGDTIAASGVGYTLNLVYDHRRGKAIAATSSDGVKHFNNEDAAEIAKLEKAVPGSSMILLSTSTEGDRMIVQAQKNNGTTEYYFYDATERRLELVAAQ